MMEFVLIFFWRKYISIVWNSYNRLMGIGICAYFLLRLIFLLRMILRFLKKTQQIILFK